jgi:hypothetical protein
MTIASLLVPVWTVEKRNFLAGSPEDGEKAAAGRGSHGPGGL